MIRLDSGCACEKGGRFDKCLGGPHAGDASRALGDGDVIDGTAKPITLLPYLPILLKEKAKQPSLITVREAAKLQFVTDDHESQKVSER